MRKANLNKCRSRKTGHRLEDLSKPIPRKSAESDTHQGVPSLGIQSKTTSLIAFNKRKTAESDSHQGVPSLGIQSKTTSLIAFTKRICVPGGDKVKHVFSIDDLAIEILSRLPIESITELKCVCKRWLEVLSLPFFCGAHFQMSQRNPSVLFIQRIFFCGLSCRKYFDPKEIGCISFGKDGQIVTSANMLDFLPEKVVIIASCNGILLCRSLFLINHGGGICLNLSYEKKVRYDAPKEVVLYVCNPFTKEFTSIKPEGKYYNGCCYGFICDSSGIINFEVIMIQCPLRQGEEPYLFTIYSSNTGTWRLSKEVCDLADRLYLHHNMYLNGVFYWLTHNYSILAYDLKQDSCRVINLPGVALFDVDGVCLGVSEGKLHFISFNLRVLQIWILEYDQWFLKHSKSLYELDHKVLDPFRYIYEDYPPGYEEFCNRLFYPQALHGDILFMRFVSGLMTAYNIKTGKIEKDLCYLPWKYAPVNVMFPYCKSILQVPSPEKSK